MLTHIVQRVCQLDLPVARHMRRCHFTQPLKHFPRQDIGAKRRIIIFRGADIRHGKKIFRIFRFGFFRDLHELHDRLFFILPCSGKNTIMHHLIKRHLMKCHHGEPVSAVSFQKLRRAGNTDITLINRISKQQHDRFARRKIPALIHGMSKAELFLLHLKF